MNHLLEAQAASGVATLLQFCGYDPTHNGIADTPRRVVKAWAELTAGQTADPARHLERTFDSDGMDVDQMIVLRRVGFVSLCEHHILPFTGHASVAYIPTPGAQIVGVSKLARVVEDYAHRLQVQERLTAQIAACIEANLDTVGVAVALEATHTCLSLRGARKESAVMVTSKLIGLFKEDPASRAEFFSLAHA